MISRDPHDWWGSRKVTLMLELLEGRGLVAIVGRQGKQRVWDLAERWYPPVEKMSWPEARKILEEKRWRALGVRREQSGWRAHPDATDGAVPARTTFLSPFDRLIHDRNRAEALFGFFYRLEMYVPKAKREYGYYVLPILRGDTLIGRLDPAFDRKAGVLRVNSVHWEPGAKPVSLDQPLRDLARFVGAGSISRQWPSRRAPSTTASSRTPPPAPSRCRSTRRRRTSRLQSGTTRATTTHASPIQRGRPCSSVSR